MKHLTVSVLSLCLVPLIGSTHHSIDADFTPGVIVTIDVLATEFRFINPHPYVTAKEVGGDGDGKEWTLMLDDRWEMVESGFSRTTIQPGDELTVTGRPSRREPGTLYVRTIERSPEGLLYAEDDGEDYDD